jgi:hypothetical protein
MLHSRVNAPLAAWRQGFGALRGVCRTWGRLTGGTRPRPRSTATCTDPKCFNLTAEPAEDAEDDEIFPLDSGTTGLGTRNRLSRACMREEPTPDGFAFSAISAVKNPG